MAIELNNRTKILAGVVVLAAAGAGAWFFLFQDDVPPPKTVVTPPASATKAADASKAGAEAPKAAADAAKSGEAPKGAAPDAAKAAPAPAAKDAGKPAAQAAAKPIPSNPDQLVGEVVEASGIKSQFQAFARATVLGADGDGQLAAGPDAAAYSEIVDRVLDADKMGAEVAANLKKNLDAERMGRYLELLRQPLAMKMAAKEMRSPSMDAVRETAEAAHKTPPSAARVKQLQSIDDVTHTTEVALDMANIIARTMVDAMLAELKKSGKNVPKESQQAVGAQLNTMRNQSRPQARSVLQASFRGATDEELGEYSKLLDSESGRWGSDALANAIRPVLASRASALGAEAGKLAVARRGAAIAKAPPAPPAAEPLPKAQAEAPAPRPEAAAAPAAPVGYQRPANIRELYTRYNDLISATAMRDRAAIKELLDDGKFPNVRQKDGTTPLMIAAGNGDADIAAMLLAKGADPNLRAAGGTTALSIAKARGPGGAEMVQLLQRSGARD